MSRLRVTSLALLLLATAGCPAPELDPGAGAQRPASGPDGRRPASAPTVAEVEEILASWNGADLVCLGEEHGSEADAALRLALVAHPRFAATVDVVLVEFASPLHQELLDRFVMAGEALDRATLRPLWLDAGLGEFWESPVYEELLRAIREVNLDLPPGQRVRVVAGAAGVDWSAVDAADDLVPFLDRQRIFAAVATEAVLAPGLEGLAVYGAAHCAPDGAGFPAALPAALAARVRTVPPRPAGADAILAPPPDALPPAWRRELDRRARLWHAAQALRHDAVR